MIEWKITMETKIHKKSGILEVGADKIILHSAQDALDLMVLAGDKGCRKIILYKKTINPQFFELKSGLAGEVLQKFANYRLKLAVVGDFSAISSKSLKSFIYESNRSGQFFFVQTLKDALAKLNND